jgi:hypothetical protein
MAIAWGEGSNALSVGGFGDFAAAEGTDAIAKAGGTSASIFDSAVDIGNNTKSRVGAIAANGSEDIAYADRNDSTASAGGVFGNTIFTSDLASNDDVAVVVDPSGTAGSFADAGAGGGVPFNSDLSAVLFVTVRASAFMPPTTFTTSCLRWVRVPAPRRLPVGATCWPSCCRCSRVAIRPLWSSVHVPRTPTGRWPSSARAFLPQQSHLSRQSLPEPSTNLPTS